MNPVPAAQRLFDDVTPGETLMPMAFPLTV